MVSRYYHVAKWYERPTPVERLTPVKLVNLTPHPVVLCSADGKEHIVAPCGIIARVESVPGVATMIPGIPVPVMTPMAWGDVYGLPSPQPNTLYLVSAVVADRARRSDLVCPGTGPKDHPIKDDQGRLVAVTRLVRREGI